MAGDLQQLDRRLDAFLDASRGAWTTAEVLEQEGPFEYALVEDHRTGREAVRTRLVEDKELRGRGFVARSVRELLVTGRLAHPGVAPVHDVGRDGAACPYVVRGSVGRRRETFDDLVLRSSARDRAWPLAKVVGVLGRAAEALAFAHDRGWAHGDLQPRHLAASDDGATEVAGWAFAQPLGGVEGHDTPDVDISLDDLAVADPSHGRVERTLSAGAFTAPELAEGELPDARSDVYALGALLYLLLAGHPPYGERGPGRSSLEVRRDLMAGPPLPVGQVNPLAPAALRAIVQRAMARTPDERFPDAHAFRRALDAWIGSNAYGTQRRSAARELQAWAGRHRLAAILAASTLAFIVAWAVHATTRAGDLNRDLKHELIEAQAKARYEKEAGVRAEGRRLTMLGRWLAPQDPTLALRFAIRGAQLEPGRLAGDVLYETLAAQREIRRFYGHDEAVVGLELARDDARLLTRDRSGLVQVCDVASGDVLSRRVLAGEGVGGAHLAPTGDRLLTIHAGAAIHGVGADAASRVLDVPDAAVGAFGPDGTHVLVGGEDGRLHLFEAATGTKVWTLAAGAVGLDCVLFLGDGARVATLDGLGVATVYTMQGERLWSVDTDGDGDPLGTPGLLRGDLEGRRLVTWTPRGVGSVYEAATGKRLRSFGDTKLAAHPPALSADGTRLFAYLLARDPNAPGAFAAVADLDTNRMLGRFQELPFLRQPVRATFSPDGQLVAMPLGDSNAVGVWSAAGGERMFTLRGHDEPVTEVRFTADGKRLWTASDDHTARAWEITPSPSRTGLWRHGSRDAGTVRAVDPHGESAVTAGAVEEGGVADLRLCDTQDGRVLHDLGRGNVQPGRIAFSGNGRRVAFVSDSQGIEVVDAGDGLVGSLAVESNALLLLLDDEGRRVAALLDDGRVLAADINAAAWRGVYDGAEGMPRAVALAADGATVAVVLPERVEIRGTEDGSVVCAVPSAGATVRDVALDPTGTRLAWVTGEGQARIFEVPNGQQVGANLDLPRTLRGLAYAPDGETLLAWSFGGVWLLDASDGDLRAQLRDFPEPIVRASSTRRPST